MKRIKTGDNVIVIAGKSKGHLGKVVRVMSERVFVEGANLIKKHVKPNPQQPEKKSGIISIEAGIHLSNVALYNPITNKADKVGFKYLEEEGSKIKVRYFKSNHEIIDSV